MKIDSLDREKKKWVMTLGKEALQINVLSFTKM